MTKILTQLKQAFVPAKTTVAPVAAPRLLAPAELRAVSGGSPKTGWSPL